VEGSVSKAVLITGCSTGIGRATAERLAGSDWNVYATARKLDDIVDLGEKGCRTLALDVCDEQSMNAAVARVREEAGGVGVLVNNAGYSQSGAVEDIPLDRIRRQFETNVFGLIRMIQLCAPGMRKQGWGRIVNLSSMGGRLVFPGGGIYHATKYAVEALSDAMRFEMKAFGINVILIEPGLIKTQFGEAAVGSLEGATPGDGPYDAFNAAVARTTAGAYDDGLMAKLGAGPDAVAKVIERSIKSRRPKPRYLVTASARLLVGQRAITPDRAWDAMMRSQFPQPGKS
jgi:NAD(P)-dependent dehydrogenase (short-subunit alcohol dehydrogenase family)